jgi:hypothetical protein
MQRLSLLVASVLVACSGGGGSSGTTTPEDNGPPPLAKRISLSWGVQATQQGGDAMADLYLALTDETGKVASHELGRYKGVCEVVTPGAGMNALMAMRCNTGGTGTELHVVQQGGEQLIILKLGVDQGVASDPMAREEVKRINIPLGVAVSVDPVQSTTGAPGERRAMPQ